MSENAKQNSEDPPKWFRWITRVSLVLGLGALIATVAIVGPHTIVSHLRSIGWWFFLLIGLEAIATCCDATAVYYMTRGTGAPSWRTVAVAQFAGRGINTVTPGGNLGEALKISLLSRHCSTQRVIAAIMFVALAQFIVALIFVAAGTGLTAALFDVPRSAAILLSIAAGVTAMIALGLVLLVRRGMLASLAGVASKLHIISRARREKWQKRLEDIDHRLKGNTGNPRRKTTVALVMLSQLLTKGSTVVTILAAGYYLSPGQFIAIMSAGVIIGWVSTIVPMGLGIHEGGNVALFSLIGAPLSLGVALALARRVNQIVFATIGFIVLSVDKLASSVHKRLSTRSGSRPSRELPVTS